MDDNPLTYCTWQLSVHPDDRETYRAAVPVGPWGPNKIVYSSHGVADVDELHDHHSAVTLPRTVRYQLVETTWEQQPTSFPPRPLSSRVVDEEPAPGWWNIAAPE